MIWLKFIAIQLIQLAATVVGWFLLIPFCLAQAWKPGASNSARTIDVWSWKPLNYVYGNPEDGVSGYFALVWENGKQVPYLWVEFAWLRAYRWSALRNSCDNLKYVFADPKGPLKKFTVGRYTIKLGWQPENGYNVPVLSWSKT